jgi:hypothetical protein
VSAEVHEFITGLPGPIRGIASGTLLEWGYLDALLEGPS